MKTSIIKHVLGPAKRVREFCYSAIGSRSAIAGLLILALSWSLVLPFSARAEDRPGPSRTTVASPPVSHPISQTTETFSVYGPQRFTRNNGQPVNVVESFSLPAGAVAPFSILVENGAPSGSNRVSSATIKLNGTTLYKSNDFNQNVSSLTMPVTLTAATTLEVNLSSAAGSYLTITLTATRVASQPTLDSLTPARTTQGQTLNVTLHGTNTHWVAGQTRASLGGEVAVGGAAQGELGPITVVNATTAIATVVVSPTAALAPRTARVVTTPLGGGSDESLSLPDSFTVDAATPPGASSANVSTIAGGAGVAGFVDGSGTQARFQKLSGVAVGPDDAIYLADTGNQRIRVVRGQPVSGGGINWTVSTLAGNGTAGFADGPGFSAQFNNPHGVAVDSAGVVYVADTANNRIRRIGLDGTVSTVAGDGTTGLQNGAGGQARFNAPQGVATDNQGNVYVADTGNAAVRLINAGGTVSTLAGDGTIGSNDSPGARFDGLVGIAVEEQSVYVYLADTGNHSIRRLDVAGTVITVTGAERGFKDGSAAQARFAEPSGIAIDGAGKIILADGVNSLVRVVDPALVANGSSQAVTTLAGTGIRGLTNGPGDVARFFTPRGLAVSNSSAIIVADTGNQVLRRILLPPVIHAITPPSARVGDTITINGERFDGRGPERNVVRFTKSQQAGGGQTFGSVTQATRTTLTVVVPSDAATGPVTVETEGGTATSPSDFVVNSFPAPVITDFTPKRGTPGTQVTLSGTNLKVGTNDPAVTFAGSNGNRLPALVTLASATEVRTTVPNGAITGVIELSHVGGTAATATPFTVDTEQDFQLTVAPSATTAVQGGSGTYVVYLTSQQTTFSQLASLTATGLPAGITATFDPAQITAGASSTLTLKLSGTIAAGSYPFTIRGVASVGGNDLERTAGATLNVMTGGQTTLSGRVLSTDSEPIIGATASLDGKTAMTDAAGSFLLTGVTAGTSRPLMVDGRTASSPNKTYPVIIEPANIIAGQANVNPYTFYLPPIDTQYEVEVVPGQNTVAGNPRVPGLQMTIPAGANLRNRDGSPVTRTSITPLAIDRTPAPLPSNVATGLVYTSQPGGAIADIPMPVIYPNLLGTNPGTQVSLYAFNHDTVQWYIYGTGTVSSDGRTIAPNINPSTGQPYGLPDFSWHFPSASPDGDPGPDDEDGCNPSQNPVDYTTGNKVEMATDVSFGGSRGGITLSRHYASDMSAAAVFGRFGRGFTDNYDVRLTGSWAVGGAGRVVMPGEQTGNLFNYAGTAADGARLFTSTATRGQLGDVIRRLTDGTFEYRFANGTSMRFNSGGSLTALVDRNGNTTTLAYTGSTLTSITDAVNRSVSFSYINISGRNLISRVTDPLGREWRYEYESFGIIGGGFLARVIDPNNGVTRYSYTNGRLSSVTDPRGTIVKEITYSGARVISQKFADGGIERYDYTLSGLTVTSIAITDPMGRVTSKRFNPNGYLIAETDALGQQSRIERTIGTNLPVSNSGPCGCAAESTIEFDARGNVLSEADRTGKSIRAEYDPVFSNPTKVTDRLDRVSTFSYDARGNLTTTVNARNETTTIEYDSFGQVTSVIDNANRTVRYEYDAHGYVNAVINELNQRETVEVDALGRVAATEDALGRRSTAEYDPLDRITKMTDPAGSITRIAYDANSNPTSVTNGLNQVWRVNYDAKDRPIRRSEPDGRLTRWQYNTNDELTTAISPLGRTLRYTRDAIGQLTSITDPAGQSVRFAYNAKGNTTSVIDQRGQTTTYVYDELDRLTKSRSPVGQTSDVTFDDGDNMTEGTDWQGRRTRTTYDPLNRPITVTYEDAVVNYTFDERNRVKRIDDSQGGFAEWTYDSAGRVLSETTTAGGVNYTYNDAGQRTSMTAANRPAVSYGYDQFGRLQTITQGAELFTYAYDALSRVESLQRPNGITTSVTYDILNRLERLRHLNAGGQALEDHRFSYTADDQISSITSLTTSTLLTGTKIAGPANALNQIPQFGDANYSFDAEGQLITKTDQQGTTNYQWDARGRLRQVSLPGAQQVNYDYDAIGRLARRTAGGITTNHLYDMNDVVLDQKSDGSSVDYLNGPGVDRKLRQTSASTGPLYFLQDHIGSTVALTNAGGGIAEVMQYEAFGAGSGGTTTRYGFTGREHDPLTGLIQFRARWYDPQQGRFISEDPAGFGGGLNLYRYASNNPLSFVDPFGMQDGPRSPLRDPVAHDSWWNFGGITNGLSNTVNDLVGGDRVAELGWKIGDHRLPTSERAIAAAELAYRTAEAIASRGRGGLRRGPRIGPGPGIKPPGGFRPKPPGAPTSCPVKLTPSRPSGAGPRGPNPPRNPGSAPKPSRPRKKTVQDAWDSAADGPNGGKLCPTCGSERSVPPGQGRRDWDLDHQPPWSQRDHTGMGRGEVLDDFNTGTRLECPGCNRSGGARPRP